MVKKLKLTPFVPKEYDEQVAVFEWAKWCKLPGVDLLYATLNGVKLPIGYAVKLSKAGLKRGPLDINLDVARGGYFGLRVELKRTKYGQLTPEQIEWRYRLSQEGYASGVAYGASKAIAMIENYLKQPRTMVIPFSTEE